MKLISFELPDDPAERAAWLERQLVGLELGTLVSELEAVHGRDDRTLTLEAACGDALPGVLERGLLVLSRDAIQKLLTHPRLLFDLQEKICINGGDYWQRVPIADEHRRAVDDSWKAIRAAIESEVAPKPANRAASLASRSNPRRLWVAAATVAVVLLAAVGLWLRPASAPPGWGWDRPGALSADLSSSDYLNHLADGANEWFLKRPETKEDLAKRLREFRHGCDTLIEAPHTQLSADDRKWLVERCKVWAGKIDENIAALESTSNVGQVRNDADATIQKLVDALRTRSKESV